MNVNPAHQYAVMDTTEGKDSIESYAQLGDATTRQLQDANLILLQQRPGGGLLEYHTGMTLEEWMSR